MTRADDDDDNGNGIGNYSEVNKGNKWRIKDKTCRQSIWKLVPSLFQRWFGERQSSECWLWNTFYYTWFGKEMQQYKWYDTIMMTMMTFAHLSSFHVHVEVINDDCEKIN